MKRAVRFCLLLSVAACAVGPDYEKPPVSTPTAFKESGDWKRATPQDEGQRGPWWTLYGDPVLNRLEGHIDLSSQTLKQAESTYREALAAVDLARASLFPTLALDKSAIRSGAGAHQAATLYDIGANASWSPDLWGRVRHTIDSQEASAQGSAADLASVRLALQAALATDYFALRTQDSLSQILDQIATDRAKIESLTATQYQEGVAAQADLLAAQTQTENAKAALAAARINRAQLEHALAVLLGHSPADFTLEPAALPSQIPITPASLPATLLERRPDIASAERQMAAANAQIGIAQAAYYPNITLSASYGFSGSVISSLLSTAHSLWSLGGSASETVLDFGARGAATEEARAFYDKSVATYRQTVLTAFQEVEDSLAAQRILVEQETAQQQAAADQRRIEQITHNQYEEGVAPLSTLLSAQISRLTAEQMALAVTSSRWAASVSLIQSLGGGWRRTADGGSF